MIQRDLLGEPVRLLAVRQPWASLLVLGHKPVENRTWSTPFRGRIAILASLSPDKGDRASQALARHLPDSRLANLPYGGVIGSVEMYDITQGMTDWWFTGPFGLLVRDARQLRSMIPHKGNLGLVECPARIAKVIRESL